MSEPPEMEVEDGDPGDDACHHGVDFSDPCGDCDDESDEEESGD